MGDRGREPESELDSGERDREPRQRCSPARPDARRAAVPALRRRRDGGTAARAPAAAARRWQSPDSLLLPIAKSLAELVSNDDFTYVKACEGPTCTLLFVDRTNGRARRWCSMAVCGNRAKQAAHRKRERRNTD